MTTLPALDIASLREAYLQRRLTPTALMQVLLHRIGSAPDHHIWISRLPDALLLERARALEARDPATLPLYGVPFAIKDNIDLAGLPTTAACPEFSYTPADSAPVVQQLLDAGAMAIGKTNLDQFATGLVGARSPYGVCRNSFDADYISGGSSSGSAVAVALGQCSFALGTDTAGSGRVPAAFNNLIGYKPSCGLLSPRGVVPACRSLDSLSVFSLCAEDSARVAGIAGGFDAAEPFSRRAGSDRPRPWSAGLPWRYGVPRADQLQFFGNAAYAEAWSDARARLAQFGGSAVEIDFEPFLATAQLLYEGPWVAERYAAIATLLTRNPEALLPVTRQIIEGAVRFNAVDTFRAQYRLAELRRRVEPQWRDIDVLITPTAGTLPRIAEVEARPLELNTQLGYYTNFVNLLDLCAVAVPAGMTRNGLPFGLTLSAPAWNDAALLQLAASIQRGLNATAGALREPVPRPAAARAADSGWIDVAVCGAHMSGLPLNPQLSSRGAVLKRSARTAPEYRLFALPGGPPLRPGLVRVSEGGASIEVEIWSMPAQHFGSFVAAIPAPLGIGRLQLDDGDEVSGFICEGHAVVGAADITPFGGWRAWLARSRA